MHGKPWEADKIMPKIVIDNELCVRCGQCTFVCPSRCFRRETNNDCPECPQGAEEACISCCHCIAACVGKAITVGNITADDCLDYDKAMSVRFDSVAHLVRTRRSIRRYTDKPLEDRVIEQLIDVVRWAPTAKNGLPVKWVIINNPDKVKELAGLIVGWIKKQQANDKMIEAMLAAWEAGNDPIFRGAPCLVAAYTDDASPLAGWSAIDTAIAVETLDLCASAMRLGACWAGIFVRAVQSDKPFFNHWLGLRGTETVHGGLMLGHVGEEIYQRIPYRPEAQKIWIR